MFFFFKTAFAAWVCALREQFVEVRFLTPYDMSNLGQCEGEGCVVCVCVCMLCILVRARFHRMQCRKTP